MGLKNQNQMSKILQEIKKQPEHIRHIMMWLCVTITFSLVAFVWFKTTQARFVAMLSSEEVREEIDPRRFVNRDLKNLENTALAVKEKEEEQSLFASIGNAFALIKESVADLIGRSRNEFEINRAETTKSNLDSKVKVKELPLSEDK